MYDETEQEEAKKRIAILKLLRANIPINKEHVEAMMWCDTPSEMNDLIRLRNQAQERVTHE